MLAAYRDDGQLVDVGFGLGDTNSDHLAAVQKFLFQLQSVPSSAGFLKFTAGDTDVASDFPEAVGVTAPTEVANMLVWPAADSRAVRGAYEGLSRFIGLTGLASLFDGSFTVKKMIDRTKDLIARVQLALQPKPRFPWGAVVGGLVVAGGVVGLAAWATKPTSSKVVPYRRPRRAMAGARR